MQSRYKRLSFVFVLMFLLADILFAALNVDIPAVTYTLYFDKAPKNTFYFSEPANPEVEYSSASTGGGIQFSLPDSSQTGSPSFASIGIYYNLESKATLQVWFNSAKNHSDAYRLKVETNPPSYLNFLIGIGSDEASAQTALEAKPGYATFDGGEADLAAKDPVLTIYSHTENPTPDVETSGVYYENIGHKVLKMMIRQPKDAQGAYGSYMGGQYKGFVIMDLTTE